MSVVAFLKGCISSKFSIVFVKLFRGFTHLLNICWMCNYLFLHLPACVLSPFSHVWFFVIPWTVALQAPLSMGFSRQEFGGVFVPSSRESSRPKDWTNVSYISCIGRQVFTISNTWEAPFSFTIVLIFAHLINYSRELSILTIFKDPTWASLVAQLVKNLPAVQETPVWFLGQQVPLEKGWATHSSILGLSLWLRWWRTHLQCWRPGFSPWVGKIPWRREWQSTPVFLPGESPWTE